jgi:hypothetical protein
MGQSLLFAQVLPTGPVVHLSVGKLHTPGVIVTSFFLTALNEMTDASTTDPTARTPNPKATNLKRAITSHIILSPSSILQFARRNQRRGRRVVNLPSLAHFHSRRNRFLERFV